MDKVLHWFFPSESIGLGLDDNLALTYLRAECIFLHGLSRWSSIPLNFEDPVLRGHPLGLAQLDSWLEDVNKRWACQHQL